MNEAQLYNLQNSSWHAISDAKEAKSLALVLMVKHLRIEHGMKLNDIAKRCGLKLKQVKECLGEK